MAKCINPHQYAIACSLYDIISFQNVTFSQIFYGEHTYGLLVDINCLLHRIIFVALHTFLLQPYIKFDIQQKHKALAQVAQSTIIIANVKSVTAYISDHLYQRASHMLLLMYFDKAIDPSKPKRK